MYNQTLTQILNRTWASIRPQKKILPSIWAETRRFLSAMSAEMYGKFNWSMVPFMRGVIDAIWEPGIRGIRCQKSAQVGWSESILSNLLGYIIDTMPAPIMVLFPKRDKGKEYNLERFEPMVEATPCLAEKVPLQSRSKGISQLFKIFPGGWLKFVGSHSADAVKSSSARYIFVEEPDDCERDVKGQGSTVKLLRERLKTFFDTLSFMGGTPTLESLSAIADEMELTDKRMWYVPCHHCGDARPLIWEQVKCRKDEAQQHPVYGQNLPETAYYVCAECGGEWSDSEKNANVRRAADPSMKGKWGWRATAPFTGLAGFYINDLMSLFPGAALAELMRKYLEAQHKADQGDINAMVEFYNNQLGLTFKYKSPAPDVSELEKRAEDYPELTVPWGGLRLTMGVDVQGNRLAVEVVAWGRGEESWRVYYGEVYGNPVDHQDEVWNELERFLFRPYRHASGIELNIEGTSIDAGDGNTSDAVYWFCRKHKHHGVVATKGRDVGEIFRPPNPVDPNGRSKASKYGLQVYLIGTEKAKDLIVGYGENGGRLRLAEKRGDKPVTGNGPGRMHWYAGIRGDWYPGVVSEIKAPMKGKPRNKLYWQVKQGVRNEPLDCEVLNLHQSRKLRINLMTDAQWAEIEARMRQPDLLGQAQIASAAPPPEKTPAATETATAHDAPHPAQPSPPSPPVEPPVRVDPLLAQLLQGKGGGTPAADAPWK